MRAMVVMGLVVAAGATAGVAINVPVSPAEKYALESPADGWELLQKHAMKTSRTSRPSASRKFRAWFQSILRWPTKDRHEPHL
ncbi:hypothetical protein JOS77_28900 [Chromobacterium haemolyticum]|nr:hypothetical protein JOS77_28900 [Chromobacterium haemolyticum]